MAKRLFLGREEPARCKAAEGCSPLTTAYIAKKIRYQADLEQDIKVNHLVTESVRKSIGIFLGQFL